MPNDISTEITNLQNDRTAIRSALAAKGVTADTHNFVDFATDIAAIPSGGLPSGYGKIVLDGTQNIGNANWRASSDGVGWLYPYGLIPVTAAAADCPRILPDTIPPMTYNQVYNRTVGAGLVSGTTYSIAIWLDEPTLTTKEAVNAYLAQHPITILYVPD